MKKLILISTLVILLIVGCKKEVVKPFDASSSNDSSSSRILKETKYEILNDSIIIDSSVITYSYDNKGRLASQKEDNYSEVYTYVSANLISVSTTYSKNDGTLKSGKYSIILDSKGLATKHYVDEKDTLFLYYTSDGFLKGNKIDHIIEVFGGNVIKETNASYEYYIDKNNTIGNENRGIYFLGKDSKNLVKSAKYIGTTVPISVRKRSTSDYSDTYEFDSNDRVIKSTKASSTNQIVFSPSGLAGTRKRVTKYEYIN